MNSILRSRGCYGNLIFKVLDTGQWHFCKWSDIELITKPNDHIGRGIAS